MARSEANVSVKGSSETAEQGHGGLGAAFLDALDLIGGHARAPGEFGDGHRQGATPVVDRLAERQSFADRDPFGVVGPGSPAAPSGCGSRSSRLPLVGLFRRAAVLALARLLGADSPVNLPQVVPTGLMEHDQHHDHAIWYCPAVDGVRACLGTLPANNCVRQRVDWHWLPARDWRRAPSVSAAVDRGRAARGPGAASRWSSYPRRRHSWVTGRASSRHGTTERLGRRPDLRAGRPGARPRPASSPFRGIQPGRQIGPESSGL